jgi:hypothetical protein
MPEGRQDRLNKLVTATWKNSDAAEVGYADGLPGVSSIGVFRLRTRFISVASSVNFVASCSLAAKAANAVHRSKCSDT